MPLVARLTDLHTCPLSDGPKPHVGGPISGPAVANVLVGSMPAAVVGDIAVCAGPPDSIVKGSTTVLIGGRPAVRVGDTTAHGGVITVGCPTVTIDDRVPPGSNGAGGGVSDSSGGRRDSSGALGAALLQAEADAEATAGSTGSAQEAALREAGEEGIATVQPCPEEEA